MIIGIGGVSNSGKSRLARRLAARFGDRSVRIFHQDQYVFPVDQIPVIDGHPDWEIPESIDFQRLRKEVGEAARAFDIIIVEGLMAFYDQGLREYYDRMIQIVIPKERFMSRKAKDKRWGTEPGWYMEHIWNSHLRFGQLPENIGKALTLDGTAGIDIDMVFRYVCQSEV